MTKLAITGLVLLALASCTGAGKKPIATVDGLVQNDAREFDAGGSESFGPDLVAPDETVADTVHEDSGGGGDTPAPDLTDTVVDVVPVDVSQDPEVTVDPDVPALPDWNPAAESCADIWECGMWKGCFDANMTCWGPCLQDASAEALATFDEVVGCFEDMCGAVPDSQKGDCVWEFCFAEIFDCLGGAGESDCLETFKCIDACPEEEGTCFFDCMKNADEEAVEMIVEMNQGDEQSMFQGMIECAGGNGQGDCAEVVLCVQTCDQSGEGGMGCFLECIELSSAEAQEILFEMFQCGAEPCFDVLLTCVGGKGDLTCGEAIGCMTTCEAGGEDPPPEPGDEGGDCFFECFGQTSPEGAQALSDLIACVEEKCGGGMDDMCEAAYPCLALCPDIPLGL